jgi:hypothetical protein
MDSIRESRDRIEPPLARIFLDPTNQLTYQSTNFGPL